MQIAFFVLLSAVFFMRALLPASAADVLITEAEASLPAPSDTLALTRGLTRGPVVAQVSPAPGSGASVKSPLPLQVKFQTRNNVPIDKDSIKLTYLRTPNVDITGRVRKHIGDEGIHITEAQVPPGNHVIRIDLRDQQGRSATGTIKLSVAK